MKKRVLIIGGGWSGLSAAAWLCRRGIAPTLLEQAPQLGGRARGVHTHSFSVDNGQHLLIQGYRTLWELYSVLGLNAEHFFLKAAPAWDVYTQSARSISIDLENPISLFGLCSPLELFSFLSFIRTLKKNHTPRFATVGEWLAHKQSPRLRTLLWEPLCHALFSTPPEITSAHRFSKCMAYILQKKNSRFLFSRKNLTELLVEPLSHFILQNKGDIFLKTGATRLLCKQKRCYAVETKNAVFQGTHVILATPPWITKRFFTNASPDFAKMLACFQATTITTVYLQYPTTCALESPLSCIVEKNTYWIFDKRYTGQAGLFAITLPYPAEKVESLTQAIHLDSIEEILAKRFGFPEKALQTRVISEKRAAFLATPHLPKMTENTPLQNVWLCGDYLHPFYPASLEAALQSGKKTAHLLGSTICP